MMTESPTLASATVTRSCDECDGNSSPRVLMGLGHIFIEETGEGAVVICLECIEKALAVLIPRVK